jgi:hypothetical protein
VANKAGNTVTPIRAASNRAGRPIRVGPGPELIAISPDGQTAYVVGVGSLLPEEAAPVTLTAIRTATNRPGRVITVRAPGNLGEGIGPDAIAITPDSRTVYVSCAGTVVPVRAGADNASEPIGVSSAGALAMAAEGRTVYVANPGGDTITPISTATEEPGRPIVVGPSPDVMTVTPDRRTVLVLTSTGVTGVTPVDAVTNRAGTPVAIQGAYALRVAPGGGTAYVLPRPIRTASRDLFSRPYPRRHRRHADQGRIEPGSDRLCPRRGDGLRRQLRVAERHPDPASRRPGRTGDRRREDPNPAGGQPGQHDGLRTRFEHIRHRDGPGNAVWRAGQNAVENTVQRAGQEAALLAGPGHSDPRRDQLCREAHKGRPAPNGHCNRRPLNRAQRRHAPARPALYDVLSTIAPELTGAAGSRCRWTRTWPSESAGRPTSGR